jgi:hypothetical protein
MKIPKSFIVLPLSLSLLIPTAAFAADHSHGSMSTASSSATASVTVVSPAADLRAALDALLSEHAILAVTAMQKGIDGKADFQAVAGALGQNTDDLSAAVASVYGEAGGAAFKEIWSSHIGYFVDYVTGTASKDEAAKKQALAELAGYRKEQAAFLDQATEGRLKAAELEQGLEMHVNQLLWAFDNYVAGDFEKAYDSVRESIHHMYGVSKALSWAITDQFPDQFENTSVDTPAVELRSSLNHLLAEHAAFAILAMQKGIDGSGDFGAAAAALGENTDDLSAAVASVYGKEGGAAFKEIWSSHIGYFVDYVTATASGDEAAKTKALAELDEYRVEQAAFLDSATGGRLPAADLEAGLKVHVDELLLAFNSYTEKDFETTYATAREAHAHMFEVGKALSGAIVDQFPEKFVSAAPTDMPKTGMGGMSESNRSNAVPMAVAALALGALVSGIIIRKKFN